MFDQMPLFSLSSAMARHAGSRQAVTATNIANADTPGYRAQTMASFGETYRAAQTGALRTTRPGHMGGGMAAAAARVATGGAEPAPNGNSVSLETEMIAGVAAQREHSRALAVYRHGLTVLRAATAR